MSTVILALIVTLLTDYIVNICLYKRSSPRFELDERNDLCGEKSSLAGENISKAYVMFTSLINHSVFSQEKLK